MSLKLQARGAKKTYWIVGSLLGERIRASTKTSDRRLAESKLIQVTNEIRDRYLHGSKACFTFAEAVEFYIQRANPKSQQAVFLAKLLDVFGTMRCQDITPEVVLAYERKLYAGKKVKNSSLIRSIYGPLKAVLNMASKAGLCTIAHIPSPKTEKRIVKAAPEDHISKLLACKMDHWMRCAILIMTLHGVRPGDLRKLTWGDVSFRDGTIYLQKTKNGKPFVFVMHKDVKEALLSYVRADLPTLGEGQPVFTVLQGPKPADRLNKRLKTICKANGLTLYTTHKIGRHAFASRILNSGYTLNDVQKAGNWLSYRVVAENYAHLERSRVDSIVSSMGINLTQKEEEEEIPQQEQSGIA